ncbi:MAG: ATP-binding cassette domain-containing protein [Candidatus Brocadiales bacterium]
MDNSPLIQVRDLTAGYQDEVILNNISFDIYRGEIFIILGASGCGKSTLLKHMIGLYRPRRGKILIDGMDIVTTEGRGRLQIVRKFGVLFQSNALLSSMTLAENVALPLREYTRLPRETIDFVVRAKLSMVGLRGYEGYLPDQLSGGMKKRAGIARAMALDPEILFFDEPSAGLDPVSSVNLDDLIMQLSASLGTTMVVVTHELSSIYTIAQRVIMLDKRTKKIIAEGHPVDLRDKSEDPFVRDFFNRKVREGFYD